MNYIAPTITEQIEAEKQIRELYQSDRALYNRARELQCRLGLGGLWRGTDTTLLAIVDAIKRG